MLSQERVIAILYEKTFPMTGLEANQQAANDIEEITKRQMEDDYGEEGSDRQN